MIDNRLFLGLMIGKYFIVNDLFYNALSCKEELRVYSSLTFEALRILIHLFSPKGGRNGKEV